MIYIFALVGIFAAFAVWPKRKNRAARGAGGSGSDEPEPLRGTWLVHSDQGARLWSKVLKEKRLNTAELVPLGGGWILPDAEAQHVKIFGASGSGKSTMIRHMLSAVERRENQRVVIVDPDGGYISRFYDESRGDRILNPFDARSSAWDLAADITQPYHADQIAAALVPSDGNEWKTYAQTLVSSTISALRERKALTVTKLWEVVSKLHDSDYAQLVAGFPAERYFAEGNERMLGSIRGVAVTACAGLKYSSDGDFSLSKYAKSEDKGWLFLSYTAEQIAALKTVIAAQLRILIFALMSRAEGDSGTWFVIDELDALGKIDSLTDALPRLRKFGGRVVLGAQTIGPLSELYGKGFLGALIENCSNTLLLKCGSSERSAGTSEYAAGMIGQREVMRTTRNTSRTEGSSLQHGLKMLPGTNKSEVAGTTTAPVVEPAVLPSQLERLENLTGYVHSHGMPFWSRCRISLFESAPRAPAFVAREDL